MPGSHPARADSTDRQLAARARRTSRATDEEPPAPRQPDGDGIDELAETDAGAGLFTHREPPVGSRPGTLVIPDDADPPRLRAFVYGDEQLEERELAGVEEVAPLLRDGRKCWIDVQGIGDERTLLELQRLFSLHPLALEDAVNSSQRPASQVYPTHHLVIARAPRLDTRPGSLELEQLSFFVGARTLLTIQERHGDEFHTIAARLRQDQGTIRSSGVDYLAYALLDAVVDQFFPMLEEMGEHLEALERRVIEQPEPRVLGEINRAKKELLVIRRALWPQRDMVGALLREPSPFVTEPTRLYLRDVHDHCAQLLDVVETYREIASGLASTYLSAVGNRTNEVMKVLTMISTIFIPLGFVAGVYGMNFEHMPELRWRAAYPVVLAAMAITALLMVAYFVRKGWIGERLRRRWRILRRRSLHL